MTRTELLEHYLKPTDLTVKELVDRNSFAQIMQFAEAYHLEQLRIAGVVSSLPTNKEISIQAENYAYKIFKNFKGREQVLIKKAYQRGCYWMRKKNK